MKVRILTAFASAALASSAASGDILSAAIPDTPFGIAADGTTLVTINSAAPVRAFYITGTWQVGPGSNPPPNDPWSTEMRIRPVLNGAFMLGPVAGRSMGGASNSSPFTHVHPGTTWNNVLTPNAFLYGGVGGAAAYASGGTYDFNFRQTFGGTGGINTGQILDGTLYALTDVVAPMSGNLTGASTMTNRPVNLTTMSAAGTYHYQTFSFVAPVDGIFSISADWRVPGMPGTGAAGTDWFDGHLSVYGGAFDPMSVLANLIGVSDDAVGGHATSNLRASGMLLDLIGGEEYIIVATHFAGTFVPTTDFTLYIAGAVPAPGALALLGLAGFVGVRRCRN